METVPAVDGASCPQRPRKRTRPWTAIPADLDESPTGAAIGDAGIAALFRLSAWSTRYETDGVIPRAVLMRCGTAEAIAALERSGLIRLHPDSAVVVGFLDVNLSHAERQAERDRWSARSSGASAGASTGASAGDSGATGQDRTIQDVTSVSAPSERPKTSASEPPGKRGRGGKGKTRRANPDATAAHLRAPTKPTESQRAWNHYRDRFERATGAKPTPLAHYFIALDRLVREHGADEIIRRVDVYFDAPPFSLRDGGRDFGLFVKCFDRLAARSSPAATHSSATPNGLLSDPNSFMRIGKVAGPNGEMIDAIPRLFPPHPRDERGGLSAPDAEGR